MKRVLITGENGYIGTQLKKWLTDWPEDYEVKLISVRNQCWRNMDFSKFDILVHAAALVHMKEKPSMRDDYFRINSLLTYDLAVKAKQEGIIQFIFLSTISVYGLEGEISRPVVIDVDTPCNPKTLYGLSKLEVEERILKIQSNGFRISILRPPIVYGLDCPGNYTKLKKWVVKLPVLPLIHNNRSMIYIDHLNEFIRLAIEDNITGVFIPQNTYPIDTFELMKLLSEVKDKKTKYSRLLGNLITYFFKNNSLAKKIFGNLLVDKKLSHNLDKYNIFEFRETIK